MNGKLKKSRQKMMEKVLAYHSGFRPEMAQFLPTRYCKVLEIGCGEGDFRTHFNQNCEYWGIEPFQIAAKVASKKLFKVLIGPYEKVFELLPDTYFDLVICNDVIEHMFDHNAFFLSIKQKLKKDSYIVGSIPNVRFYLNLYELVIDKDWKYKGEGILDQTHLRFFTEKSLKRILIEHEFIIEEFSGINKLSITANCVRKIINKILIYILGGDVQFPQFGFRDKYPAAFGVIHNSRV